MEKGKKNNLSNFEKLTETPEGQLVGGFSATASNKLGANGKMAAATNNCHGGNCAAGCGSLNQA